MIVFNMSSWHFNIVLYVFGKSFFFQEYVDSKKIVIKMKKIEEKIRRVYPNDDNAIEIAHKAFFKTMFDDDELLSYTLKRINFCPYCRALVMSVFLFPFAVLKNLIPRREKKPFDIKKSRRNTKIIKAVVIAIFAVWGTINILYGNFWVGIFQYVAASFQWWGKYVFDYILKRSLKKEEKKEKDNTPKLPKNPSLLTAYLKSNHDKVCPPVTFVDENDTEVRV